MHVENLRNKTARTLAAGFLALTQGRHQDAVACADGALVGLFALGAQGVQALDLIERAERLEGLLPQV